MNLADLPPPWSEDLLPQIRAELAREFRAALTERPAPAPAPEPESLVAGFGDEQAAPPDEAEDAVPEAGAVGRDAGRPG